MGDVYLACDRILDRKVAIKILNHRFRGDETVIIRFHKEAKSYARVNHANAVVLFDYGQLDDGNVYLVMEYVDGCNLTDYMRRIGGPMPQDIAHALASQLSEALIAAHAQGVVHRDLKPDNVYLITRGGDSDFVKILDFGIAKLLDDQSDNQLTQAGMVFGTPEFMSPEQAQGIEVDHRTDIYAFGMRIVYYMLTHRLPFEGKNKIAILNQQRPASASQRVGGRGRGGGGGAGGRGAGSLEREVTSRRWVGGIGAGWCGGWGSATSTLWTLKSLTLRRPRVLRLRFLAVGRARR